MKKIYFLLISIFTIFMLNSTTAKANSLNLSYDESKTLTSISKDEPIANYLNNFIAVYNDKPLTITPGMISLDTSKLGEQITTVTYDNQSATTSAIVCTPSEYFTVISTSPEAISKYTGSSDTVVIPKYINKTEITTLGNSAFMGKETLTSIVANNITTISNGNTSSSRNIGTFIDCTLLSKVYFPKVTLIGDLAFQDCKNLNAIFFPKATSIGTLTFQGCISLNSTSFPEIVSIGDYGFDGCSNLKSVSFPKATSIEEWAFYNCSSLKSTYFPNVTIIKGQGFFDCTSLVSVSFPKATTLKEWAFIGCSSLKTISIPNVTSIGYCAFSSCFDLKSIELPKVTFIDLEVFYNCNSLASITFGTKNPPVIKKSAFKLNSNLKSWTVYVPKGSTEKYENVINKFEILEDTNNPKYIEY